MADVSDFGLIDKYICADCLNDSYLKEWVNNKGEDGYCDYCQNEEKVVLIDDLMENVIIPAICKYYDLAVENLSWDGREGGYQGNTYDSQDIMDYFSEDISYDENVLKDIEDSFPDETWCEAEPFRSTEFETYKYSWNSFSNLVKYKNRYFFFQEKDDLEYYERYSPLSILNIIEYGVKELGLIKTLPKNTDIYRCRIFENEFIVKTEDKELGSPPDKLAKNGRMNATGIAVFYGSERADTCLKETTEPSITQEAIAVVGKFQNINDLKYLDLTEINNIPLPSIFNINEYSKREVVLFLKDFNKELSKSINDLAEIEYVPAQIFAEYCKLVVGLNGIKYNSAKDENGTCIALFFDNEECTSENNYDYKKDCQLKLIDTMKYKLSFNQIT